MAGLQATALAQQQDYDELSLALRETGVPNGPYSNMSRVLKSTGKGQGLFATKFIPRGTPILIELPLFSVSFAKKETFTAGEIRKIEAEAQKHADFGTLTCGSGPDSDEQRFHLNNFEMGRDGKKYKRGIFLKSARINHSCLPNAFFMWNYQTGASPQGRLTIHAIEDIKDKDEISINYRPQDYYQLRVARQTSLNLNYGFQCSCKACIPNTEFADRSDERRDRMAYVDSRIGPMQDPDNPDQRFQQKGYITELLDCFEGEGDIYPQLADAYHHQANWNKDKLERARADAGGSASNYVRKCHAEALKSARLELNLDVVCTGHASPAVKKTLKFIRELGSA